MRRARYRGGVSLSHPYSRSRRTAMMVPTPSKCSARPEGTVSIELFQVPSADCCAARIRAGLCASTRFWSSRESTPGVFATSTSARYLIGPPAWSSSQLRGKATGSGGGAGGAGTTGVGALEGDGNVTAALAKRHDAYGSVDGKAEKGA